MRQVPTEAERDLVTCGHRELPLVAHLDAGELNGRVEDERIWPSDGDEAALRPPHPGDVVSVLEAHEQLGAHSYFTFDALHDPHDPGMMMPRRHEVDNPDDATIGGDLGLEYHRVAPISADMRHDRLVGCDLPAAMLVSAEQLGEAASGVESRKAQPVDRTVSSDQGGSLGVADDRVVFDGLRHYPNLRWPRPRR